MLTSRLFLFSITGLFLALGLSFSEIALVSGNIAKSAVEVADASVRSAYEALVEAEQVGGNVSTLLTQLNEAQDLLSTAQTFYGRGDFDMAIHFANLCNDLSEDVERGAQELKRLTLNQRLERLSFTMASSILGVTLTILGSFWLWRFLKRRYIRTAVCAPAGSSDDS